MKKTIFFLLSFIPLTSFFLVSRVNEVSGVDAVAPQYNIPLLEGESFDNANAIIDNFDNGIDSNKWYLSNRAWANVNGRTNGGVVPENVFFDSESGSAILRTAGDYYAEDKIHTPERSLTEHGRRSGADLISKFFTYPGRYEVRMKVAPRIGVCTTMWTYIEYGDYVAKLDGRHNHEIDIELPWTGDFKKVSFGNYVGGFEETMHKSEKVTLDYYLNDGEYHTFGFDWYYNDTLNHKLIRYYIDGQILSTIDQYVPFYKTKVNIGIWCPDSKLAAPEGRTSPLYDKAYCDIDYFKYVPFANNHHEDATSSGSDPYTIKEGTYASIDEYPTTSTPNIIRNYFPNGSFDFVEKMSSSKWLDSTNTGIENNNIAINKTSYDRNSSSVSGGALIYQDGYLAGYIDSCHQGQKYNLSIDYKYKGTARIKCFGENDALLSTISYPIEQSNSWEKFSENFTLNANGVEYIAVAISADENTNLLVDNIELTLGHKKEEIDEKYDHFMTSFHNNPSVLAAFDTVKDKTGTLKNDIIIDNLDYSSNISWRLSSGKFEAKNNDASYSITMGLGDSSVATSSDEDYLGIYTAINSEVALTGKQSVIYSTSYIQNLTDISLAWGSCENGIIAVAYKLKGEDWSYLSRYVATSTNGGTGDKTTWNRRQFIINKDNNEDFSSILLGETAKIAFLYSNQNGSTNYIRMNSFIINKTASIKGKINYWSKNNANLCQINGALYTDKSLEKFDLLMTNYNFNQDDANALNVAISSSGSAKEATYFAQYAYLCNIANISVNAYPSNSNRMNIINDHNITIVVVAFIGVLSLGFITLFIKKKKKNNF